MSVATSQNKHIPAGNIVTEERPPAPTDWFVTGLHPLAVAGEEQLLSNAASMVTQADRDALLIDHPMAILTWLAQRPAVVPRRSTPHLFNDTIAPLVYGAMTDALRIKIKSITPVEAVGRIYTLDVEPVGRPDPQVMLMVPFDFSLQSAWTLYYSAVRDFMTFLVEGVQRVQLETWFDFWNNSHQRVVAYATAHRRNARVNFCAAQQEFVRLAPGKLTVAELTYVLSRLVSLLNSL